MNAATSMLAMLALAAADPGSREALKRLDRNCQVVQEAYPMLMLAVMAEGGMNCATHTGDYVDCDANDTPEQAAKQAKRLEIRQRQEAVFAKASEACDLYKANRKLESAQHAASLGVALAAKVGTLIPDELKDDPAPAAPE